jgi:hypothetical protein
VADEEEAEEVLLLDVVVRLAEVDDTLALERFIQRELRWPAPRIASA